MILRWRTVDQRPIKRLLVTSMSTTLVLGGPGCGKTTRLLDIVEEEMQQLPPNEIAFVAFTNAAADEAKVRAAKKFNLNPKKDLPWFRTIHSLAYRQMSIMRDEVMSWKDWRAFGTVIGERMTGGRVIDSDEAGGTITKGDQMLQVCDFARTTFTPLKEVWDDVGIEVTWWELERFSEALQHFKQQHGKIDFTDMLTVYIEDGDPVSVKVAVIDEAQDLTPLQWKVVDYAFAGAERFYIGGDDDQAIYHWAGADTERFLNLDAEQEVLPISHRLSQPVFEFSQRIVRRISHRYEKQFRSKGHSGSVQYYQRPDQVELGEGTWLLLARNGYLLKQLEQLVRWEGYPYKTRRGSSIKPDYLTAIYGWEAWRKGKEISGSETRAVLKAMQLITTKVNDATNYTAADQGIKTNLIWHEALIGIPVEERAYYTACLRRGENLKRTARIRIDTIHGVKGAEADHVLLLTDMSARTFQTFTTNPDSEHRVFYVGSTRARYTLHIVGPQSPLFYPV